MPQPLEGIAQQRANPPVVSVAGYSNSGKTTLIEAILSILTAEGYRIGTIKHHAHHFDMDRPGKDTWRHREAGASSVLISSGTSIALIRDHDAEAEPTVWELVSLLGDVDLVIAEGYKGGAMDKIVVHRFDHPAQKGKTGDNAAPVGADDERVFAVVSDQPDRAQEMRCFKGLPVLSWNDGEGVARLIKERYLGNKGMA